MKISIVVICLIEWLSSIWVKEDDFKEEAFTFTLSVNMEKYLVNFWLRCLLLKFYFHCLCFPPHSFVITPALLQCHCLPDHHNYNSEEHVKMLLSYCWSWLRESFNLDNGSSSPDLPFRKNHALRNQLAMVVAVTSLQESFIFRTIFIASRIENSLTWVTCFPWSIALIRF